MGRSNLPAWGEGAETGGQRGKGSLTDREHPRGRGREGGGLPGAKRGGVGIGGEGNPAPVHLALFERSQQDRGRVGHSIGAHEECRSGWVRVGTQPPTLNGGRLFPFGTAAGAMGKRAGLAKGQGKGERHVRRGPGTAPRGIPEEASCHPWPGEATRGAVWALGTSVSRWAEGTARAAVAEGTDEGCS
jgi:hypothetical protein